MLIISVQSLVVASTWYRIGKSKGNFEGWQEGWNARKPHIDKLFEEIKLLNSKQSKKMEVE